MKKSIISMVLIIGFSHQAMAGLPKMDEVDHIPHVPRATVEALVKSGALDQNAVVESSPEQLELQKRQKKLIKMADGGAVIVTVVCVAALCYFIKSLRDSSHHNDWN